MRLSKHHQELTDGVGKCSVPMWSGGCPAGFCDEQAYGERPPGSEYLDVAGELRRTDGRYAGYIGGLACPKHGGPQHDEQREARAARGDFGVGPRL